MLTDAANSPSVIVTSRPASESYRHETNTPRAVEQQLFCGTYILARSIFVGFVLFLVVTIGCNDVSA